MATDSVFEAVQDHLSSNWDTTPIQWENEPEIAKADASGAPIPWIMVEMTGTLYGQQSIGASRQADNRWDEEGQIFLHVFVPSGTGGKTARLYSKQLADLFRGQLLASDRLEFLDAQIGMGESGDDDGAWFRISTSIDYRYMEA